MMFLKDPRKMTYWKWLLCFLLFASLPGLQAFDFSRDGQPLCSIVVPEKMHRFERMAADDLKNFLQRMTGAEFRVVSEKNRPAGSTVYLGKTMFSEKELPGIEKLPDETAVIKTVGKNLILRGSTPIGTFYAVWNLLQKTGVYSLAMDQDMVPSRKTLSVDADGTKTPPFPGRTFHDSFPNSAYRCGISQEQAKAYNLYLLRNRINGNGQDTQWLPPYYTGKYFHIPHFPQFHSLQLYVPSDRYFMDHPEYFSMDAGGHRVKPRGVGMFGSLCMSNPEVARVTIDTLRNLIRKDRSIYSKEEWPRVYDISLLDDFPYICKCQECRKITEAEGDAGLLLTYVNRVARTIRKEYPDIRIRTMAYASARVPPKTIRPEKNVMIQWCDAFTQGDTFRPMESKFNDVPRREFLHWAEICGEMAIWDYWNIASPVNPPLVETVLDSIQPDLKFFAKNHVKAMFLEFGISQYAPQNFHDLQLFVGAQVMYDLNADVESLIRTFIQGFYGPAAPEIQKYLTEIREGVRRHPRTQVMIRADQWCYMNPEFAVRNYFMLKQAAQKCPPGSRYRSRVETEMIPLIWTIVYSPDSYQKAFAARGVSMGSLEKECRKYCLQYINRFGWKNTGWVRNDFEKKFESVIVKLPKPELFKNVPNDHIHILGYPLYRNVPSHNSKRVNDPQSLSGQALRSAFRDPARHGAGKIYSDGKYTWCATRFFLENIVAPGRTELTLKKVPQDEKYHWYKIPGKIRMASKCYFWGHGWGIQMDISKVYVLADGVSDNNDYEGYFMAKFTGPAYVKGSKQENAIWIDLVVLVRPGEKSLENLPSGLVQ